MSFDSQNQPQQILLSIKSVDEPHGDQQQSHPVLGPKTRDLIELSKSLRKPQQAEPRAPLGELAALANTLNSESDALNGTIQTISEKLRSLNFGVEVWCKGSDGVDFGFCRIGDP